LAAALAGAAMVSALTASVVAGATPTAGPGRAPTARPTATAGAAADAPVVLRIRIQGAITAVAADYLDRALMEARARAVDAVLVEVDTPGGDTNSTGRMTSALLNAAVPTVVWVGPEGARAASAGTFLVLAAHVAAMAPRTTIGAASPVASGGEDLPETLQRKATEDLAAQARTLGERRSPQAAGWAERAVRDAASATADEALELGVIDIVAGDSVRLLDQLDGREVTVAGATQSLRTSGALVRDLPMTASEGLLSRLAHPAVALLLLTIGVNAILIELGNPGGFVAGIVGVLALALGFYSLGVLEANLIGLAFMGAAFALFVLELKTPTHGLFTVAGIGLFVGGAVVLFSGGAFGVPWLTIIVLAAGSAVLLAFVVAAARRALLRQPTTGSEGLIGARGRVVADLAPRGKVLVQGEVWDATAVDGEPIARGSTVRVSDRDGYTLRVTGRG